MNQPTLNHGPYGEIATSGDRSFLRLTDQGRDFLNDRLAEWNNDPIALLRKSRMSLFVYAIKNYSFDDINHLCRVGFVEAVVRFQPDRGAKFATYASMWVMKCVRDVVFGNPRVDYQGNVRGSNLIEKFLFRYNRHGFVKHEGEWFAAPDHRFDLNKYEMDYRDEMEAFQKWTIKMTDRQRSIVFDYFIQNKTMAEISSLQGVSKQAIEQTIKRMRKKLRNAMRNLRV